MSQADAPRILIADDDAAVREMIVELLTSNYGARVTPAENGQAAVTAAALEPFDACILDVEMPVMNGLEACRRIRATAYTKNIPVLILTGLNDQATIDSAFEAGAWDFLSKPVHGMLLWRRVSNMLTLSKVSREAERLKECVQLSEIPGNLGDARGEDNEERTKN